MSEILRVLERGAAEVVLQAHLGEIYYNITYCKNNNDNNSILLSLLYTII